MASVTWDNTATVDSTNVINVNSNAAVQVSLNVTGTLTAGTVVFEVTDDGNNWYAIPGIVQSTFAIFNNWQPSFGSNVALQFSVVGFQQFRCRLNPVLTGTGNVTVAIGASQQPYFVLISAVQQFGPNLHTTLDDAAGGNAVNTVAKGTQGARALASQDLKDSGRVIKVYSATFTGATTEALISLTPISDGTPGGAGSSFTITASKRFRIQAILLTVRNAGAAIQGVVVNLRMSATGVVTAASPLVGTVAAGTLSATANAASSEAAPIPDGLEFSGTMQFGLSQIGTATAGNTVTLIGYEY